MAISSASVSVTTTATLLSGADSDNVAGQSVFVTVPAAGQTVFLGGPGVTAANGYPVATGTSFPWQLELGNGEALYGIVAATTQAVSVLRSGV